MPTQQAALDSLFRALGDPTRRAIVGRLARSPASVSDLARDHAMALPSFLQHLHLLSDSGLVRSRKVGRVRTYRLVPQRLARAEGWLAEQRSRWERRLDQLDAHLVTMDRRRNA